MFVLTQVGNHDALHYGNLVTCLRIYGLVPAGAGFDGPAAPASHCAISHRPALHACFSQLQKESIHPASGVGLWET
jgi:hypothetical protein